MGSWETYGMKRSMVSPTVYTIDNMRLGMVPFTVYTMECPMDHTVNHGLHYSTHHGVFHAQRPR